MTPFEEELKQALQRQEPPAGFHGTCVGALREQEDAEARRGFWRMLWSTPIWRFGMATSCSPTNVAGGTLLSGA